MRRAGGGASRGGCFLENHCNKMVQNPMGYLPIFINVGGRSCVVIGGGEIAERKARALVAANAAVLVISPALTDALAVMAVSGTIRYLARSYHPGDLDGAYLAFAATGESDLERTVAAEASARGIPINVADVPDLSSFIAPAVIQRGALQIAVSTGGASPALARKIREDLEGSFGPEYELMIDLLAAARDWLRTHEFDLSARGRLLASLVRSDLRERLKRGDLPSTEAILNGVIGATLADLGINAAALVQPLSEPTHSETESR
jgi:precorrin-2 dehydrogenase/sirohydrochlorin ferrochelatase